MITDCFEANNRIVRGGQEKGYVWVQSWQEKKNRATTFFRAAALVECEYQIAHCIDRKRTSTFLLREVYIQGYWCNKNLQRANAI
jgi:hypothetical protein